MVAVHRSTVGLFWCHPLVLPQFEQLISEGGYRLLARRLEANRIPDFENLSVPKASVHVVEAHPQLPVTESVVTGIHARQPAARILVLGERFSRSDGVRPAAPRGQGPADLRRGGADPAAGASRPSRGAGLWVGRALLSRFVDSALCTVPLRVYATGYEGLTRRERQVLDAVLDNLSNKEIARRLQMSERTAKFHVSNLLVKHGVRRRADLLFRRPAERRPPAAPRAPAAPSRSPRPDRPALSGPLSRKPRVRLRRNDLQFSKEVT